MEYGELGSWELSSIPYVRDISPEASPFHTESKAGVGRVGHLEGVAFSPLIISTFGKSSGGLETLGRALAQALA